jgi:hypothetical protein
MLTLTGTLSEVKQQVVKYQAQLETEKDLNQSLQTKSTEDNTALDSLRGDLKCQKEANALQKVELQGQTEKVSQLE